MAIFFSMLRAGNKPGSTWTLGSIRQYSLGRRAILKRFEQTVCLQLSSADHEDVSRRESWGPTVFAKTLPLPAISSDK